MSEELHNVDEANAEETKTPSIEELAEKVKALSDENAAVKASKDRILEESKGYKAKLGEVTKAQTEKEKALAIEKEDYKRALEIEQQEKSEWISKFDGLKKTVSRKELDLKLAQMAPDARDFGLLKAALNPEDLKWDEDLNLHGLEPQLENIRKEKAFLFNSDKPAKQFDKKAPNYNGAGAEDKTDEAYFARIKTAKSQQEFDAIRKEFGRFYE